MKLFKTAKKYGSTAAAQVAAVGTTLALLGSRAMAQTADPSVLDQFIDAIVAWGDESAIRKRIQQQWDAGADQVCIKAITPLGGEQPDEKLLALLAPARTR